MQVQGQDFLPPVAFKHSSPGLLLPLPLPLWLRYRMPLAPCKLEGVPAIP